MINPSEINNLPASYHSNLTLYEAPRLLSAPPFYQMHLPQPVASHYALLPSVIVTYHTAVYGCRLNGHCKVIQLTEPHLMIRSLQSMNFPLRFDSHEQALQTDKAVLPNAKIKLRALFQIAIFPCFSFFNMKKFICFYFCF